MTDLKHLVAYTSLRAVSGLIAALPLGLVTRIGEWLGRVFGRLARGRREMAAKHARRIGVGDADLERHLRRTFAAYGRYWAEALWTRPSNRRAIEAGITHDGVPNVETPRDAGTGMIYVLPHMGNWEFAGPLAASLGIRVVAVAENLANGRVRDWFIGLRDELGIDVVLATGSRQVMRELEAAIARNDAVALLADRDLAGRGVEVEFFGERTTLPAGPATLALRTGAPILPVASYFSDGGHHVVIRPPVKVDAEAENRSVEIQAITQRIAAELEQLVLAAPEQWHLLQPNWPSDQASQDRESQDQELQGRDPTDPLPEV